MKEKRKKIESKVTKQRQRRQTLIEINVMKMRFAYLVVKK